MSERLTVRDHIRADCLKVMAELHAMPARRTWYLEQDRRLKRDEIEHLLDDWLHCAADG